MGALLNYASRRASHGFQDADGCRRYDYCQERVPNPVTLSARTIEALQKLRDAAAAIGSVLACPTVEVFVTSIEPGRGSDARTCYLGSMGGLSIRDFTTSANFSRPS